MRVLLLLILAASVLVEVGVVSTALRLDGTAYFGLVALATPRGNIEAAAERFDCNKTKAVLIACEVAGDVLDGVEDALEHEDLPPRVRNELAETISTRCVNVETTEPEASANVE